MKEYLLSLLLCSVFATVLCSVFPSESLTPQKRFIAGLCMICVAIKPAVSVVEFIRDFDVKLYIHSESEEDYAQKWEDYSAQYSEKAVKDYIEEQLHGVFATACERVTLTYHVSDGNMIIEKIYIQLPRESLFKDTAKIKVYFERMFSCEVVVAIG